MNETLFTVETICAIAGPIIAILVSLAKKVSFVNQHPKIVALGLSVLTSLVSGMSWGELNVEEIVACTLVPFSAAVASYEVVKSATKEA